MYRIKKAIRKKKNNYSFSLIVAFLVGLFRKFSKNNSIMLIEPSVVGMGSIGDQALILGSLQRLITQYPDKQIILGLLSCHNMSPIQEYIPAQIKIGLINKKYLRYIFTACGCSKVFMIGADVLDGKYSIGSSIFRLRLMRLSEILGIESTILGFSYNGNNDKKIISAFNSLKKTKLNTREKESNIRLFDLGIKRVNQTADVAFLMNHSLFKLSDTILDDKDWVKTELGKSRKVVALNLINWNITDDVENSFLRKIADVLFELQKKNSLSVILVTHDNRKMKSPRLSDIEFLSIFESIVNSIGVTNVRLANSIKTQVDVKYILENCDFAISGRMHMAIASFTLNKPVISFAYQGKFEGLYNFFKFPRKLYFDLSVSKTNLIEIIQYVIDNETILKDLIAKKLPELKELAASNFNS